MLCSSQVRSCFGPVAPPRKLQLAPLSEETVTPELFSSCHLLFGKSQVPSERTSGLHIITPPATQTGGVGASGTTFASGNVIIQVPAVSCAPPVRSAQNQRSLPSGETHTSGSKVRRMPMPSGSATNTSRQVRPSSSLVESTQ